RGNILERQLAAVRREDVAAVPSRGNVRKSANEDDVGLAAASIGDLNACDTLQRFDNIVVRQLADVFGDDGFDDLNGFALVLEALHETFAHARHDDGLDVIVCDLLCRGTERYGERRQSRRRCKSKMSRHDDSPRLRCGSSSSNSRLLLVVMKSS